MTRASFNQGNSAPVIACTQGVIATPDAKQEDLSSFIVCAGCSTRFCSSGLTGGQVAGIIFGSLAAAAAVGLLLVYGRRVWAHAQRRLQYTDIEDRDEGL